MTRYELIVIGCSLGGMRALQQILPALPEDFPLPIAVVQHRYKLSSVALPQFLTKSSKLKVVDVEDKQWIKPGTVYMAPADYHLLVEEGMFSLSVDERSRSRGRLLMCSSNRPPTRTVTRSSA